MRNAIIAAIILQIQTLIILNHFSVKGTTPLPLAVQWYTKKAWCQATH